VKWSCLFALASAACGFRVEATSDTGPLTDAMGVDAPDPDPDAAEQFCYGAGMGRVCLTSAPTAPLVLPNATLDTGVDPNCTQVVALNSVDHCVVAATTITVPVGSFFRGRGARPLILVATQTVTIEGTASVSSLAGNTPGAGSMGAPCVPAGVGEADPGGAGGGAGGSFGGTGGMGGTGDLNMSAGGDGSALGGGSSPAIVPTSIRAGCPGGAGGVGLGAGGAGGRGGGAMYLIAGTSITVALTGRIYAVGEGGKGGVDYGGGGGGGAGGFIGLDAPTVTNTGVVIANGGGGGEGAPGGETGDSGDDGPVDASCAIGGSGWQDGGNGGVGSCSVSSSGGAGIGDLSGGGGGGGGAGFIYIKGALTSTGAISPIPSVVP